MSFRLFEFNALAISYLIVGYLKESYRKEDVIRELDHAMKLIEVHDYQVVFSLAAATLGGRDDVGIQYVIDYAIDKKIPLILIDSLRSLTHTSIDRYVAYLNMGGDLPIESIAEARRYLPNVFIEAQWSGDREFVSLVQILIKVSHLMTVESRDRVRLDIVRVAKLVKYEDFIALIKLRDHPCQQLEDVNVILPAISASLQNPDVRVFDYFYDTYLVTRDIDLTELIVGIPVARSFRKLILFAHSIKQYPQIASISNDVFVQLALLGTFKDPLLRNNFSTIFNFEPSYISDVCNKADLVICCLKSKLPNVLVDLIIQYIGG